MKVLQWLIRFFAVQVSSIACLRSFEDSFSSLQVP